MIEKNETSQEIKKNLFIVSNRLPVTIEKRNQDYRFRQSVGGLATGLGSIYKFFNSVWLGWCGINSENVDKEQRKEIEDRLYSEYRNFPIFLSRRDIRLFYSGFCNKTVWPLFHYFVNHTIYDNKFWEAYKHVNKIFADGVLKKAGANDLIWVHDYQLLLLPHMLREKLPHSKIGFFLHIPFPSFEIFRALPWRKEILKGILGADLIGFHSHDYVRHFLSSTMRLLGLEHRLGAITMDDRRIKVETMPMGINYDRFARTVETKGVKREKAKLQQEIGQRKVILSVDRLDYTKGIVERLESFDCFLEQNRSFLEKIKLILVAVPSRTSVETYSRLKKRVDEVIGRINGKYSTLNWTPITYIYRSLPFKQLVPLYSLADVALVTPMRDGMNLIAKEYLACRTDNTGVLILSEMAGAAKELGEALIINPHNRERVAEAIKTALLMPEEEQKERNRIMQARLKKYDAVHWATDFLKQLQAVENDPEIHQARKVTSRVRSQMKALFRKSDKKLFLLDYDGTLISHKELPVKAKPVQNQLKLLKGLTHIPGCRVVLISGRDRNTLQNWFGELEVDLVAEHGVWIKEKGQEWSLIEPISSSWKAVIRPFLEEFDHRTPGAFIEEKEYSLVFHYRKVDPGLASMRVIELKDTLIDLTANYDLAVTEGNKIIEIKSPGINKGRAVALWLKMEEWDFIFSAGDDRTDEDMFRVLPDHAYSIKVGIDSSAARFHIPTAPQLRDLLEEIIK